MAYEIPGFAFSLVSAADLRASQYCFVDVNNGGQAALPSAAGRAIGVLQNKPNVGEIATIVCSGVSKVKVATGNCTAGDALKVDGTGGVLTAATSHVVGVALASGTAGEIIPVLIRPDTAVA